MSRILFVVFPEAGHLNPFIGIAQHLESRGHQVSFYGSPTLEAQLARAGLAARVLADGSTPKAAQDSAALTHSLQNARWAELFLRRALVDSLPAQVARLEPVVREHTPDVICLDAMAYAGAVVAARVGVPWVAASTNFITAIPLDWSFPYLDLFERIAPARRDRLTALGLEAATRASDVISPHANLIFATDAFVDLIVANNAFSRLVGPSLSLGARGDEVPFPWERLRDGAPLIYASFGSQASPSVDQLRAVIAAVTPELGTLVLSAKDQLGKLGALPDHVIAVAYAPQLELVRRADLVISSGGANSITECLTAGKPVLVIPFVNDQPIQARLIVQCGAGLSLAPEALDADSCRAAIVSLGAANTPARETAARIERSYRACDGATTAADVLERFTAT